MVKVRLLGCKVLAGGGREQPGGQGRAASPPPPAAAPRFLFIELRGCGLQLVVNFSCLGKANAVAVAADAEGSVQPCTGVRGAVRTPGAPPWVGGACRPSIPPALWDAEGIGVVKAAGKRRFAATEVGFAQEGSSGERAARCRCEDKLRWMGKRAAQSSTRGAAPVQTLPGSPAVPPTCGVLGDAARISPCSLEHPQL